MPFLMIAWGFIRSGSSSALTFFSKPPGTYIGIAIAFALSLWWFGQHEFDKGRLAAEAQAANAAAPIIDLQHKITVDVGMKFEAVKLADTQATEKRLNEVESHVTTKADAACIVPTGFVRVWNDAAHGSVPPAAAGPDDAASGVALSEVAKTTVEDFGQYDAVAHQLTALQDWVRQQEKANP